MNRYPYDEKALEKDVYKRQNKHLPLLPTQKQAKPLSAIFQK